MISSDHRRKARKAFRNHVPNALRPIKPSRAVSAVRAKSSRFVLAWLTASFWSTYVSSFHELVENSLPMRPNVLIRSEESGGCKMQLIQAGPSKEKVIVSDNKYLCEWFGLREGMENSSFFSKDALVSSLLILIHLTVAPGNGDFPRFVTLKPQCRGTPWMGLRSRRNGRCREIRPLRERSNRVSTSSLCSTVAFAEFSPVTRVQMRRS